MARKRLDPIHPGEILLEEFLKPLGLSQNQLARDIDVPATRINDIVNGLRPITVDTALRLSRYFGNTAQFWLNLQQRYDLVLAERDLGATLDKRIRPHEQMAS
ncbi:MAG: addiction module antidote protein, HigA family [Planctomycetota bacterium]|nr:MAG: addiction module antidote protein, HigA family [Planctomycetota bacterium]REJ89069.1 MAG: addiction module antidote protein, HigA family [Planctomycetota bacterium]REK17489.1 MAG: addiction module antidote protein, HigA family [Planctomycetota bacterium]